MRFLFLLFIIISQLSYLSSFLITINVNNHYSTIAGNILNLNNILKYNDINYNHDITYYNQNKSGWKTC